jgi:hypothetical protein
VTGGVLRLHSDDELLERALANLEPPDHTPEFSAELREQLKWERFVVTDILARERRGFPWRLIRRARRDL